MDVHILVLNYNGSGLLAECLPSILDAAGASRHRCQVAVLDNQSSDDSLPWLAARYPALPVFRCPNRGLCSFNDVLPRLSGPVAVLLNNDIKLATGSIDPLVAPLDEDHAEYDPACFMTAPLCWQFDGRTYEGFRTAVGWRWGLVQATALYPGHQSDVYVPSLTASAGAAMAVDRRKFLALDGFDPRYLPGRLEDLDFAFRAYQAGYRARYVPAAVAYHRGMATFGAVFGAAGCDRLALRNSLLFQWKNLRHPWHVVRQLVGLPLRLLADVWRAPWTTHQRRWAFSKAMIGALARVARAPASDHSTPQALRRERDFFRRFHPRNMAADRACPSTSETVHVLGPARTGPSPWERQDHVPAQSGPTPIRAGAAP